MCNNRVSRGNASAIFNFVPRGGQVGAREELKGLAKSAPESKREKEREREREIKKVK